MLGVWYNTYALYIYRERDRQTDSDRKREGEREKIEIEVCNKELRWVKIIFIGNGFGERSSNPGWDNLSFT